MTTARILPPEVSIPPVWCPLPQKHHPALSGANDRLLRWARRFDLVRSEAAERRFYRAQYDVFCAATYPRAVDLDLMIHWNAFNWILDDLLDEAKTSHEERIRICREVLAQMPANIKAPRPTSPLAAATADLWRRSAPHMSIDWRKRYLAHYIDWVGQSTLSADASALGENTDTLYTHLRERRIHSGCELSFDLLETGNHEEVPAEVTQVDAYEAVRASASDAICWTNDIYSIRKETARGDYDHLVPFLARDCGTTWDEALATATHMIEIATRDYLKARTQLIRLRPLLAIDDEAWQRVENSLEDLGYWISGSLYWHRMSDRYSVVERSPVGETPPYIELHIAATA